MNKAGNGSKQYPAMFPSASAELRKGSQHKKKKKKKHKRRRSSSGSSSSDGDQWVEKPAAMASGSVQSAPTAPSDGVPQPQSAAPAPGAGPPQRDEWMTVEGLFEGLTSSEVRDRRRLTKQQARAEEDRQRQETFEALRWRDKSADAGTAAAPARPVGDGGAGWLRRALERARQQAREQGRSLDEVVADRWGSMEKLQSMLDAAERRSGAGPPSGGDERAAERRLGGERRTNGSGRWRRARSRDRRRSGSDERRRSHSGERRRSRSSERRRNGSRERKRSRSAERSQSRERRRRRSAERRRSESRERRRGRSTEEKPSRSNERRRSRSTERKQTESRERRRSGSSEEIQKSSGFWDGRNVTGGEAKTKYEPRGDNRSDRPKTDSVDKEVKQTRDKRWRKTAEVSSARISPESNNKEAGKERPSLSSRPGSSHERMEDAADEDDDSGQSAEPEAAKPLTDGEMNALAAKILKAELNGDDEVAETLQKELEAARRLRTSTGPSRAEKVVIVVDKSARTPAGKRPAKRRKPDTHRGGERTKYFADDDRLQLRDMFERERQTTPADEAAALARLAGSGVRQRLDDEHGLDEVLAERAGRAEPARAEDERRTARALAQHRHLERCDRCFDSRHTLKHLIVALGGKSYLSLPAGRSVTEGHCLVVPLQHAASMVALDEDAWEEVTRFRAALVAMFAASDQDVVFFESVMKLRAHPHAVLQCVPLPRETGELAPIYFKKALEESETEWSQNKKVVDLRGRDVRRAVPKGLPYFSVDFGLQPGFAHVIEDEELFPATFAQQVIAGMLELEPSAWRHSRNESLEQQRTKVLAFTKQWEAHDFTRGDA